jgi:hypothetical protein
MDRLATSLQYGKYIRPAIARSQVLVMISAQQLITSKTENEHTNKERVKLSPTDSTSETLAKQNSIDQRVP